MSKLAGASKKEWFERVNLKTLKMPEELRATPEYLARQPLHRCWPDACQKIRAYDQITRRPGEVIGDYIVREQRPFREMTEALRRVRNSPAERTGARRLGHPAPSGNSSVYSDEEYEMVEDEEIFTEAPWQQEQTGQTFFELEIRGPRSPKCRSATRRATDGSCWNKKRHGAHSCCDTAA